MNWGKSMFLAMGLFMIFIVGMGIYMSRNSDSLYEENYYQKGEDHTKTMEGERVGLDVEIEYASGALRVELPIQGKLSYVLFKNMANSNSDRRLTIEDGKMDTIFDFATENLVAGSWHIIVAGEIDGKNFTKNKEIIIE